MPCLIFARVDSPVGTFKGYAGAIGPDAQGCADFIGLNNPPSANTQPYLSRVITREQMDIAPLFDNMFPGYRQLPPAEQTTTYRWCWLPEELWPDDATEV